MCGRAVCILVYSDLVVLVRTRFVVNCGRHCRMMSHTRTITLHNRNTQSTEHQERWKRDRNIYIHKIRVEYTLSRRVPHAISAFSRTVADVLMRRSRRSRRWNVLAMPMHWAPCILTLVNRSAGVCVSVEFWTFNNKSRSIDVCRLSIVIADSFADSYVYLSKKKICVRKKKKSSLLWIHQFSIE